MESKRISKKVIRQAAKNAGSYLALGQRIGRSRRAVYVYQANRRAPAEIAAKIEAIALGRECAT